MKSSKLANKCMRKQKRALHRFDKDLNIEYSDKPTQFLAICNAGLMTGLRREILEQYIQNIVPIHRLFMPPGKSYCFIDLHSVDNSKEFYDKVHGRSIIPEQKTHFYLIYIMSIPNLYEKSIDPLPPGLRLITDFISTEEELILLKSINWEESEEDLKSKLKYRNVKHFGYKFQYDNNSVDIDHPTPIPTKYEFLQNLFKKHDCGSCIYDQITVNKYLPGQGIPFHIDTHSVFANSILSLSLGSPYIMDFKKENKKIQIDLPPRSLLVMTNEARYAWSHGICPRHNDYIKVNNDFSARPRGTRISFTFRKVRTGDCLCQFKKYCDSKKSIPKITNINNSIASEFENSYVHNVYENISNHFNETRHKQWPNVTRFIQNVETGGLLLDVGCGNGKYLFKQPNIFKVGCDRSTSLAQICQSRDFQIILTDCLQLPFKSNILDAVLCIAVIHHFSTTERRIQAVSEIMRILKVGGSALIYVWAKEQNKNSIKSTYLKLNNKKKKEYENTKNETKFYSTKNEIVLPIHKNRTEFTHSDMLVPWKCNDREFLRFYHIFEQGELENLCSSVPSTKVKEAYYDEGNWCVVLEKI